MLGKTSYIVEYLQNIPKQKSIKRDGIWTVQLHRIFREDTIVLGFGMPNVFLAQVNNRQLSEDGNGEEIWDNDENAPVTRFDAKSAYREPNKILRSRNGNEQSGIYLVPNLSAAEIRAIRDVAAAEIGATYRTCCYAISTILHKAGFTIKGKEVRRTWPTQLLTDILRNGIMLNGRKIDFLIVSSVREDLVTYIKRIKNAQRTPLTRIIRARLRPVSTAEQSARKERANEIAQDDRFYIQKVPPSPSSSGPPFAVDVSNPSQFGLVLRKLWGHHSVYRRILTPAEREQVIELFPNDLPPFPKTDTVTFIKRNIIFSKLSVKFILNQHQSTRTAKGSFTAKDAFSIIPAGQKFNYVLTPAAIAITAINSGAVNWVLSKHMLLAAGDTAVKMAGEIWSKPEGQNKRPVIYFNANSGTFQPGSEQALAFGNFARRTLFPGADIIEVPWN